MNNFFYVALGFVTSYLTKLYRLFVFDIRLDIAIAEALYHELKSGSHKHVVFTTTQTDAGLPTEELTFHFYQRFPFLLKITERELKAGWRATEPLIHLTTLCFYKRRLLDFVSQIAKQETARANGTIVRIWLYSSYVKTNVLVDAMMPFLPQMSQTKLNRIVQDFVDGKRSKAGVMCYGSPGNGKTALVKALAVKNKLPIYVPIFGNELTNADMLDMFRKLPSDQKKIVLFEDFDNVFDNRKPLFENARFSFDTFINIIDGCLIDMSNTLFFMTTNDIQKIDKSLRQRPSRFDLVLELGHPTEEQRLQILRPFFNGQSNLISRYTENQSAAVVAEITRRSEELNVLSEEDVHQEVTQIIQSFDV